MSRAPSSPTIDPSERYLGAVAVGHFFAIEAADVEEAIEVGRISLDEDGAIARSDVMRWLESRWARGWRHPSHGRRGASPRRREIAGARFEARRRVAHAEARARGLIPRTEAAELVGLSVKSLQLRAAELGTELVSDGRGRSAWVRRDRVDRLVLARKRGAA
jgi:hypothetical protein